MKQIVCSEQLNQLQLDQSEICLTTKQGAQKVEAHVEAGQSVRLFMEFDKQADIQAEYHFVLEKKASLKIIPLYFTDQSIDAKFTFILQGDDAVLDMKGLAVLSNRDTIKIETLQKHLGVNTRSIVEIYTLAAGNSLFGYEGIIRIAEGAADTFANQQNKNILLSPTAQVQSIPTIEVLNKNVQCFHGSACGTFDPDQVWYLQSRGLEKSEVQKVLLDAFCKPVLLSLPWKSEVLQNIEAKIT